MNVTVFGKTWCAYCDRAKELLEEKDQKYTFVNVEESEWALMEMRRLAPGASSVPQIIVDGTLVPGGYDGLRKWYKAKDETEAGDKAL